MASSVNIYCDESCHLERDTASVMVLGALACPTAKAREIADRLRDFRERHDLPRWFEIKWTKVSPAKEAFYLDVLDYFFDDDDLRFRALVVPDKSQLRHVDFAQDHDTFYYKMYYTLLKAMLSPEERYSIFLDIKDTRSHAKEQTLREVLCSSLHDRDQKVIERLQSVRSVEVQQIQLADLLIGIVSYANRGLQSSSAKTALVERMRKRSGYRLTFSTLLRAEKVNLFRWDPR
ncbi:MAG: DUF3800 domain-containing protein [Acidobacteriota bacterium]|nr:DUF3800 domain-containing protein [Acidobacteriota bacterium]